jgi:hypothetical protein
MPCRVRWLLLAWVLWAQAADWLCFPVHECVLITHPPPVWQYKQAMETKEECEARKPADYDLIHEADIPVLLTHGKRSLQTLRFVCLPEHADPTALRQDDPGDGH